jgi:plastocyanin
MLLAVPIVLGVVPANAGIATVGIDDNLFSPGTVSGTFGGNIVWDWLTPSRQHNVRQNKGLFSSGLPTSNDDATFVRTFSAGTFPYYCEVHGSPTGGMRGTIKVRPATAAAPDGPAFTVGWASGSTNTGSAFDVQYRVGTSGDWLPWLTDTTDGSAVFGDGNDPLVVEPGTTYQFRARSQKSLTATAKVSKYSPKVSFTT